MLLQKIISATALKPRHPAEPIIPQRTLLTIWCEGKGKRKNIKRTKRCSPTGYRSRGVSVHPASSIPAGTEPEPPGPLRARCPAVPGGAGQRQRPRPPRAGARCPQGHPQPPVPAAPYSHRPSLGAGSGGAGLAARRAPAAPPPAGGKGRAGKGREGQGRTPRPRPRRARQQRGERRLERGRPGPRAAARGGRQRGNPAGPGRPWRLGNGSAWILGPASIPRNFGPCSSRPHVPPVSVSRMKASLPKP